MAPHRSSACRFGLKRDRRKLHIEPLHLPPEDSRASKYQSETSLGVKASPSGGDKNNDKDLKVKDHDGWAGAGAGGVDSSTSRSMRSSASNVGTSSISRGIQKISIHGNDASRHAPAVSSNTTKALCASSFPSASMKNKNPKDLDF